MNSTTYNQIHISSYQIIALITANVRVGLHTYKWLQILQDVNVFLPVSVLIHKHYQFKTPASL